MDTIQLRTLTYKSRLGFGKYQDLTIQEILNLKHTQYLRYCYYNFSTINFIPEILKDIFIISKEYDNRIEKPGSNPELFREINDKILSKTYATNNRQHINNSLKVNSRIKIKTIIEYEKRYYSKSSMQSRNHGH